uniref:Mitochondrial fission factor n=1 Tax=Panagrolaimus sp. JU765 TaxID=591449 RepID=A0AC34R3U5_9BILA
MTFTLTSTKMEVPDHIYVNGAGTHRQRSLSLNQNDASRVFEAMRVPERIVYAEGNSYYAPRATPPEMMADKSDTLSLMNHNTFVPQTITAYDIHERTDNVRSANAASESSIAIEEAPIREIKVMRKQLIQLANRVTQIEDSNSRRATREAVLWVALAGLIATLFFQRRLPIPR